MNQVRISRLAAAAAFAILALLATLAPPAHAQLGALGAGRAFKDNSGSDEKSRDGVLSEPAERSKRLFNELQRQAPVAAPKGVSTEPRAKRMRESQSIREALDQKRHSDIERIKQQLHEIRVSAIPSDQKIQKQRLLLSQEIDRANAQQQRAQESADEIDRAEAQQKNAEDSEDEARDHRKALLDSIQKYLDILHSMNPQI